LDSGEELDTAHARAGMVTPLWFARAAYARSRAITLLLLPFQSHFGQYYCAGD
jgi:hypothetical protein